MVTTYNWDSNLTYNWGNPYKPIQGDYKKGYNPSYQRLLSPMGLQARVRVTLLCAVCFVYDAAEAWIATSVVPLVVLNRLL